MVSYTAHLHGCVLSITKHLHARRRLGDDVEVGLMQVELWPLFKLLCSEENGWSFSSSQAAQTFLKEAYTRRTLQMCSLSWWSVGSRAMAMSLPAYHIWSKSGVVCILREPPSYPVGAFSAVFHTKGILLIQHQVEDT